MVDTKAGTIQRSMEAALKARVERGFLQNLDDGNLMRFLLNPSQLQEVHAGRWTMLDPPGLSHQRLQYMGGQSVEIPLTLFFDQLFFDEARLDPDRGANRDTFSNPHFDVPSDVEAWRRFLLSLQTPRRSQRIAQASPPPVLFSWPGILAMRVRVLEVRFSHTMFASRKPFTRVMTAQIKLVEDPTDRIYSEDMIRFGTFRRYSLGQVRRSGSASGGR